MGRFIGTEDYRSCFHGNVAGNPSATSQLWRANHRIVLVPFVNERKRIVRRLWSANGNAVSGNIDLAIVSEKGTVIASKGTTAQAGAVAVQFLDITDFVLEPGRYFWAMQLDNTSGKMLAYQPNLGVAAVPKIFGLKQASPGASPIGAVGTQLTLTTVSDNDIPIIGMDADNYDNIIYPCPPLPVITPWNDIAGPLNMGTNAAGAFLFNFTGTGTWATANRRYYYPFHLETIETFDSAGWYNGATVGTNSVNIAIYSAKSNKRLFVTADTLTAGASGAQRVTGLGWVLGPGDYYLSMCANGTTDNFWRTIAVLAFTDARLGFLEEAAAFAAPATMTGATASNLFIPAFWIEIPTLF